MRWSRRRLWTAALAVLVLAGAGWIAAAMIGSDGGQPDARRSQASQSPGPGRVSAGVPAGTVLTSVPGRLKSGPGWHWDGRAVVIDADHTTLDGLDIAGAVANNHDHLRVKNARIRCANENDWCITMGGNSTISDSDIGGGADGKTYLHAILIYTGGPNNVIDGVNLHHTVAGIRLDNGTTVRNSYIHDLNMGQPVVDLATGKTHTDYHSGGIMITGAQPGSLTPIRIEHNRFEGGNTANLFVQRDVTDTSKRIGTLLIQNNMFLNVRQNDSDSSFGVDIENKGIQGPITIRNNTFNKSTWTVGPIRTPAGTTTSGNVYTDGTSVPVSYG